MFATEILNAKYEFTDIQDIVNKLDQLYAHKKNGEWWVYQWQST